MREEVLSDLVANVWQVLVTENSEVAAGDTLLILESMKMEIPVNAEHAGVVREVAVIEGQVVQEGDLLLVVEYTD